MHDPKTVAFDIYIPKFWERTRTGLVPRIHLITIWHVDPEVDGDEDSCNFLGLRMPGWLVEEMETNDMSEETRRLVRFMWWALNAEYKLRPWWKHPKWHFRHWEVQIHLVQRFKRWAFSRCMKCGKRFSWKDAGGRVIGTWGGRGPAWFENAEKIWHMSCEDCKAATEEAA